MQVLYQKLGELGLPAFDNEEISYGFVLLVDAVTILFFVLLLERVKFMLQ